MIDFERTIKIKPTANNRYDGGEFEFCTSNRDGHMNFYVRRFSMVLSPRCISMTPDEAQQMRDALIEAYPLEASAPAKKPKRPHGAQEYKGNGKHDWEPVIGETERLRVPGGWLYQGKYDTVFVPVPEAVGYVV